MTQKPTVTTSDSLEAGLAAEQRKRWRRRIQWSLPFFAAFLPIVLLSVYSYSVASQSVQALVQSEEITATGNLSQMFMKTVQESTALINAFSSVPGTVQAMEDRDQLALSTRLKAIVVSFPEVDRALITTATGQLVTAYPSALEITNTDFSSADWFQSTVSNRKGYISGVYQSSIRDEPVIAFAAPIVQSGSVIGAVAFEYPTKNIARWLDSINLSGGGHAFLVDQQNALVAHPDMAVATAGNRLFAGVDAVAYARSGNVHTTQYVDPVSNDHMIATFLPLSVGANTWIVVAQQPTSEAYAELNQVRLNISLAGGALTILTFMIVVALGRMSAKNIRLNLELQSKNQKLREVASIVQSSNDAIIGLAADGTIQSWNKSAETIYGYTSADAVGQPMQLLVPEEKQAEFSTLLSEVQSGAGVENVETERKRRDGSLIPVSLTLSPVYGEDGTVVGVSSIDRDITERKEIEQMKNDFISFVSHQLKAPVTAMRWMLEELFDGDFGELGHEVKEILQEMQEVNTSNYKLITDILNISRIDRGVIAFDAKPVQLREVAEKAMRDYHKATEKAGLYLRSEGMEQDIVVMADADKMAEAVSNAISNAIKHTESGGITVRLIQEDGYGVIEVEDTGEGMSPEIMEKLFTRDQILGGSASPDKSAGLGLYIATNFMQMQGGAIDVRSEVGKGSTFLYKIPLADPEDKPAISDKE